MRPLTIKQLLDEIEQSMVIHQLRTDSVIY